MIHTGMLYGAILGTFAIGLMMIYGVPVETIVLTTLFFTLLAFFMHFQNGD